MWWDFKRYEANISVSSLTEHLWFSHKEIESSGEKFLKSLANAPEIGTRQSTCESVVKWGCEVVKWHYLLFIHSTLNPRGHFCNTSKIQPIPLLSEISFTQQLGCLDIMAAQERPESSVIRPMSKTCSWLLFWATWKPRFVPRNTLSFFLSRTEIMLASLSHW